MVKLTAGRKATVLQIPERTDCTRHARSGRHFRLAPPVGYLRMAAGHKTRAPARSVLTKSPSRFAGAEISRSIWWSSQGQLTPDRESPSSRESESAPESSKIELTEMRGWTNERPRVISTQISFSFPYESPDQGQPEPEGRASDRFPLSRSLVTASNVERGDPSRRTERSFRGSAMGSFLL